LDFEVTDSGSSSDLAYGLFLINLHQQHPVA